MVAATKLPGRLILMIEKTCLQYSNIDQVHIPNLSNLTHKNSGRHFHFKFVKSTISYTLSKADSFFTKV